MPLRVADPSLWNNFPGCVAAYQPVAAPGPLMARYNMARGGDARYQAADGVAPSWTPTAGWTFDGSTQYLKTRVSTANASWTMLARFSNAPTSGLSAICGYRDAFTYRFLLWSSLFGVAAYENNQDLAASSALAAGVLVVAAQVGYRNGIQDATGGAPYGAGASANEVYIGCANDNGSASWFTSANCQVVAIYNRTLAPNEIWVASQQVMYCDVNPAWSAWAPQRRWFFIQPATPSGTTMLPATAATSAATAPYDDDDWVTPDNAKANDGSYAYIDPFSAASVGPNYPGGTLTTVNTTAPYDDLDWDDKTGVGADDTDYASITSSSFDTNVISYLGKAQGYGFAIPARAVITGIEVVVAKSRSAGTSCVDACVQLLDGNGALFGNNKADGATNWPSSITGITYGGAGDMWGLNTSTLTPAIVNDADFGVGIAVKATANNVDANVDYITVKVYYNDPTFDTNDYSYLLKASNFAFVIPTEATVTGVKVSIERKAVGTIKDAIVKLLDGSGALQGNDKADTSTAWPTSDTAKDYGGDGDTWGATVTPAVINDQDFGVAIAVKADAVDSSAYIDYVTMTVYYTVSSGTTYNMAAAAASVGVTPAADLARTMSMAPVAAAVGLTPSVDLARIIAQAASADAATATGTPTLLAIVMLAAAAAATGATSTADLARVIAHTAAANGVTVTSTADLLRIIGQAAAANAAGVTSTADLARVIAQAAAANGITVTGDANLTVATLISLAAQVLATGATSTADLARIIAHTAAAAGATATSTADLARLIAQAAAITAATATSTADLLKLAGMVAAANAATVTSTADLLKLLGMAGSADGVTVTSTADLMRIIGQAVAANATTATSTADLARVIALVTTLAGVVITSDADLAVSGGLIHLAALVAAVGMTPAADLSRLIDQAGSAAAASATPQADLSKLIGQAALASAQGNTSTADLLRAIALAASADGATVTPTVDLLKLIDLAGSSAGVTVTPGVDLARLVNLVAGADAVTTVSLAELLVAGLMEIYRRRIPDAVRVGSRGVSE